MSTSASGCAIKYRIIAPVAIPPVSTAAGQSVFVAVRNQVFHVVHSGVALAHRVVGCDGNWGYNAVAFVIACVVRFADRAGRGPLGSG